MSKKGFVERVGLESFAQYIRRIRKERGMNLRDLEQPTGLSNAYFSQLENGHVINPSIKTLYQISIVLRVPLDTLVDLAIIPFQNNGATDV